MVNTEHDLNSKQWTFLDWSNESSSPDPKTSSKTTNSEFLFISEFSDVRLECSHGRSGTSCCTSSNPCGAGEGDCDSDAHCRGSLKCGEGNGLDDNCDTSLGFPANYDCCYEPG